MKRREETDGDYSECDEGCDHGGSCKLQLPWIGWRPLQRPQFQPAKTGVVGAVARPLGAGLIE
jgi:hypothetical protein